MSPFFSEISVWSLLLLLFQNSLKLVYYILKKKLIQTNYHILSNREGILCVCLELDKIARLVSRLKLLLFILTEQDLLTDCAVVIQA